MNRSKEQHRDSDVVDVDVNRSLWNFLPADTDREILIQKQKSLKSVINAVINSPRSDHDRLYYYQVDLYPHSRLLV